MPMVLVVVRLARIRGEGDEVEPPATVESE